MNVMIFSLREGGYMRGGVRYDRYPRAIQVVADKPAESPDTATSRRKSGTLTESELTAIHALIGRAERADQEPALTVVDAVAETSALDRSLREKRAQVEGAIEHLRMLDGKIAATKAERKTQEKLTDGASSAVAEVKDRLATAHQELRAAEGAIGELDEVKAKYQVLLAKIAQLEQAGE